MTKLCGSCGRPLDDYARFCDRCGSVQPLQPSPQIRYQYPQPPEPVPPTQYQYSQPSQLPPQPQQVPLQPPQPQPAQVWPPEPQRAGVLGRIRGLRRPPKPTAMPVPEAVVSEQVLRPSGRRLNYVGILAGIIAFITLILPWWTAAATLPVTSLATIQLYYPLRFSLYLYEASASFVANPALYTKVVTLDLWFCWVTLALVALAGILAIVGSVRPGKGKRILVIGGLVALVSIVVFAVGLESELSRTGSGLDLFNTVTGTWGTLSTYLSLGFWSGLIAGAIMLIAARRSSVIAAAPLVTVQSRAPEVGFTEQRVPRPLGVMLLAAYCSILGVCAIAGVYFASSLIGGIHQLFPSIVLDVTYVWVLLVFSAVVDFVIAYGLLKRKKLVRTIVRIFSGLAIVGALIVIGLVTVLVSSPALLGAGSSAPLTGSNAAVVYGGLTIVILLGVILPLGVFWYMGRRHIKEYFGIAELPAGPFAAVIRDNIGRYQTKEEVPRRRTEAGPGKFCRYCGAPVLPDSRFCRECGQSVL